MESEIRAKYAKDILDNPVFTDILTRLESRYMRTWRESSVDETSTREQCYLGVQVVGEFQRQVRVELEKATIETARKRRTRKPKADG